MSWRRCESNKRANWCDYRWFGFDHGRIQAIPFRLRTNIRRWLGFNRLRKMHKLMYSEISLWAYYCLRWDGRPHGPYSSLAKQSMNTLRVINIPHWWVEYCLVPKSRVVFIGDGKRLRGHRSCPCSRVCYYHHWRTIVESKRHATWIWRNNLNLKQSGSPRDPHNNR
jgi:hypothetical protein